MKRKNTMKLWQMLTLAILLFAVVMSMFLPVISIKGTKVLKATQDATKEVVNEKTSGLGSLLNGGEWENDEYIEKMGEEFDEIIKHGEEQMGINLSSLSGISFIMMDTNALLLSDKDYNIKKLEKAEQEEIFNRVRGTITTFKILLAIVYFGAIIILTFILLSFFLKWSKYIMSIISSVFGVVISIIFAISRWGIPLKLVNYSDVLEDEVGEILDKGGIGFLFNGSELVEPAVKSLWGAILGMGVMTCFILGILICIMGILTCIIGKASVPVRSVIAPGFDSGWGSSVQGGFGSDGFDAGGFGQGGFGLGGGGQFQPGPIFPPVNNTVKRDPDPVVKQEPPKPPKPKCGRVKCTQGAAMGQGFKLPEDRKVIVGKSPQNATLVIHDQHVSNVHCSIRYRQETDSYIVKDHSTNGTFVQGIRLAKEVAMEYPAGTVLSLADGTNKITLG